MVFTLQNWFRIIPRSCDLLHCYKVDHVDIGLHYIIVFKLIFRLCNLFQQFPRVTSIGSLPPKTLGKSRRPPQNPRDPPKTLAEPRRTLGETPHDPRRDLAEASEGQISSESLAEGCAPRKVTLRNFRIFPLQNSLRINYVIIRPALSGGMDWWRMEWPFSRVRIIFFRGRNFQENA